ncbi:MAG: XdhC family protein [Acidobacteriota bacterium]|nr:XdhC family protein [Acidobacteriota bacterium]
MIRGLDSLLAESLGRGERVARATVVTAHGGERALLIWPAGHTFGDLGWPRLNQRVALYAEQLFEKGPREMIKAFDLPDGSRVDVRFEFPHLA